MCLSSQMYPVSKYWCISTPETKQRLLTNMHQSQKQHQHKWAMCRLAWLDSSLPSSVRLQDFISWLDLLCCCMSCRSAASFQFSNTTPLCVKLEFTKCEGASIAALVMPIALYWLVCEKLASRILLLRLWLSAELTQSPQLLSQRMPESAVITFWCRLWCVCFVTSRNRICCLPCPSSLFVVCCCASYCDWVKPTFIIVSSSLSFDKHLADTLHHVDVAHEPLMHSKVCSILTWFTSCLVIVVAVDVWKTFQSLHLSRLMQLDWIAMAIHLLHEHAGHIICTYTCLPMYCCLRTNYTTCLPMYCCCVTIEPADLHHYVCSSAYQLFRKLGWANTLLMQLPLLIPHCKAADCHLKHTKLLDLQRLCRHTVNE